MSTLFNFEKLITENYNVETLIKRTVSANRELYFHSSLNFLREFNESYNTMNKKLYASILESENKTTENNNFSEYFEDFKNEINKFTTKMTELGSRFKINVDNIIDTHKELIEDNEPFENIDENLTKDVYNYFHMGDNKFPKLCPVEIYKKEFDEIGRLMQELSPMADDDEKLKIIAAAYSNLAKDLNNEWNKRCIEDILQREQRGSSFAEDLYASFKSSNMVTITLDKGAIYNSKEILMNYKMYVDSATEMIDYLIKCFNTIASEVGEMIFRNKDYKLQIRTETDGVADKDYELDTYSMNNLNMFIKAKTNQMVQLCNLYTIAVSIKLDMIVSFIKQEIDILDYVLVNKLKMIDSKDPVSADHEDDDMEDYEDDSMDSGEITDNSDETSGDVDSMSEDGNEEQAVDEPDEVAPDTEIIREEPYDTYEIDETEELSEAYLFEYSIFNFERVTEQQLLNESISLLLEEDTNSTTNDTKKTLNIDSEKIKKAFESAIDVILEKLAELFRKFYDYFVSKVESKREYIENNKKSIQKAKNHENIDKILNAANTYKVFHPLEITNITVPSNLNIDAMRDSLVAGDKEFINRHVGMGSKIASAMSEGGDSRTIKAAITSLIIDGKNDPNSHPSKNTLDDGVEYCTVKFKTIISNIRSEIDNLKNNKRKGTLAANESVSNLQTTKNEYFTEMETNQDQIDDIKKDNEDKGVPNGNTDNKSLVKTYYTITSQLLAAKMTVSVAAFNEYYEIIKHVLQNTGNEVSKENKEETK